MGLTTTAVAHRNGTKVVSEFCPELNRSDRIIEAFGSVIPRVQEESLARYYEYLKEHLGFPFLAHFPKPMNSEEDDEFRCTVLKLFGPAKSSDDGVDGLYCKTRKGIYELNLPLIDLHLPEDSFRFQLIEDYWYWLRNWR
jgi:hypothetical protein